MGCYVPDDGPLIVLTVWTSPTEIGQVDTEVDCLVVWLFWLRFEVYAGMSPDDDPLIHDKMSPDDDPLIHDEMSPDDGPLIGWLFGCWDYWKFLISCDAEFGGWLFWLQVDAEVGCSVVKITGKS